MAKLLPIHSSHRAIARSIISNEHSLAESSTASSVSFSSGDEDCSQGLSSCSSGEEASSRKDGGVLDEKQSKFGDEETAGDELKQDYQQQSLSTDEILPALEGALVHLRKTSQKTQGMIETMMGIQFASLGRYKKAVSHFESASQLGYSKAQYNLGQCYELGQGVELDLAKAVNLYERAAEQDHPLALYKLGMYHYHGLGATPEDESVGFKFMQRAAEAGVILAHSFLGNYYLQTKTRDVEKAILHLRAAVEEQVRLSTN